MSPRERERWRILLSALGYTTPPHTGDISPGFTIVLWIACLGAAWAVMGAASH